MVGPSEIVVIGVIVLLLLLMGRSRGGGDRSRAADDAGGAWEMRATIRVPKYLASVLLALATAAAVAGLTIWLQFPGWVSALSGGVVAGAGVAAALQRGRRARGR